jgi:hypothetical protein
MIKLIIFAGLISMIQSNNMLFRACNPASANYGPPPLSNTIIGCDSFPCEKVRGTITTNIYDFIGKFTSKF